MVSANFLVIRFTNLFYSQRIKIGQAEENIHFDDFTVLHNITVTVQNVSDMRYLH